jgi:hypothetical protein
MAIAYSWTCVGLGLDAIEGTNVPELINQSFSTTQWTVQLARLSVHCRGAIHGNSLKRP